MKDLSLATINPCGLNIVAGPDREDVLHKFIIETCKTLVVDYIDVTQGTWSHNHIRCIPHTGVRSVQDLLSLLQKFHSSIVVVNEYPYLVDAVQTSQVKEIAIRNNLCVILSVQTDKLGASSERVCV